MPFYTIGKKRNLSFDVNILSFTNPMMLRYNKDRCICGSVDRVEASEAFGRGFESLQVHSFYA